MNKMVKAVKRNNKITQSSIGINIPLSRADIGSRMAQNQKLRATETASTMGEFLNEAQAELENLFT